MDYIERSLSNGPFKVIYKILQLRQPGTTTTAELNYLYTAALPIS